MNTITYQPNLNKVNVIKRRLFKKLIIYFAISVGLGLMGQIILSLVLGGLSLLGLFMLLLQYFSFIKKPYIEINDIGIKCSSSQYKIIPWDDVKELRVLMLRTTPYLVIDMKNNNDYLMKLNIPRKFLASISMKQANAIFTESLRLYEEEPNTILTCCLKFMHKNNG